MSALDPFAYDREYFDTKMPNWTDLSFKTISDKLRNTILQHPYSKGGAVLDYGCGIGVYCDSLLATGLKVVGADISPRAIIIARQRPYADVLLVTGDRIALPDDSISFLFTTEVLEHIEHEERAISEFRRLIESGGLLVLTTTLYFSSINTYLTAAIIEKHSPVLIISQLFSYIFGFFSERCQRRFVKRWCFDALGGHFHGFHIRQLTQLLVRNGFELCEVTPLYIFEPVGFCKWMDSRYLGGAPLGKRLFWTLPMLALRVLNVVLRRFTFTANNIYLVARKGHGV